ncbi:hypothetical protein BLA24_19830 [Streptomyces cinnamoneus]|uniref:DUF397 domain-containing protein n=2 Tax=Streptomyces cinnamoneus TaxID=53446 RepID=A0A2G1XF73_STRCJ|nr:DUF397 domain-containing protein [Streptomyces cinnamoneus]PHQ49888.1 hypothetical protein BLA24_19830 [Streptomyces cinnamoneus]PPT13336.1 DUF397 domain-containing protein [Streptomyces cinnamoneus]
MTITPQALWHKSSYSSGGDNCVEVATQAHPAPIAIRDSKHPHGPLLTFSPAEFRFFTRALTDGTL